MNLKALNQSGSFEWWAKQFRQVGGRVLDFSVDGMTKICYDMYKLLFETKHRKSQI